MNKPEINLQLNKIRSATKTQKLSEIKSYIKNLLNLYNNKELTESELGYFITSLVQFADELKNVESFSKITKNSGLLELPESQIEQKGYNRTEILTELIRDVEEFVSLPN